MTKESNTLTKSKTSKVLFVLIIIVFVFWMVSRFANVYSSRAGGTIFEILWLPMIAMTFILPILALINWSKEKFNRKSLNLYSIILAFILILSMIFNI